MKKPISILLAIITILSTFVISASAASKTNAFNIPTSSKYAKVYTISKSGTTIPYTSKYFSARGTTSKASNTAYIDNANDELYLLDVGTTNGTTWAYVSYPVGSKRYKAYIKLSAISDAKYSKSHDYYASALGKFYCSNRKGDSTSSSYCVDKGDEVYVLATNKSSGTYCQILYPISGNKWRIGWCKYNDVKKYLYGDTSSETNTSTTTSSEFQWPMKNYTVAQGFNKYNSYMANNYGRAYHCGIDIVSSSNTNIYATADGIVKYRGGSKDGANGYHIVIQHNLNGEIIYSSYSHLSDYSSCPAVGKTVSKDTKIGVMGNTGRSSGAHLHFAIYKGYTTDPYGYATGSGSNKIQYGSITYYNPSYVIANNKLP